MRPTIRKPTGSRRRGSHTRAERLPAPAVEPEGTAAPEPDLAAQRVREAGGPIDLASYTCECGCLFTAPVSTTVKCPHCGTGQAW